MFRVAITVAALWLISLSYGVTSGLAGQSTSFQIKRMDDGFLRLDSKTGQTDYCQRSGITWACRVIAKPLEKSVTIPDRISGLERVSRYTKTMFKRFISSISLIKSRFVHNGAVK